MLLAIDIGNTNISLGVFKGRRLAGVFKIPTKEKSYLRSLKRILEKFEVDDVLICSVVPNALKILTKETKSLLGKAPYIIGKKIKVPIKNRYLRPAQVGQDRLVNAYAGTMLYGAPLVVVDFGTAVTFDIVSKKREYLGGMIFPGLEISLDALFERTALLPRIKLGIPRELIGGDTKNSMLSGIVYGFAAVTDDLVMRIKEKIGRFAKVIATGGNISLIEGYCKRLDKADKDLTLKGIRLVYENYVKNTRAEKVFSLPAGRQGYQAPNEVNLFSDSSGSRRIASKKNNIRGKI
ncbi:MAG: type III pantothenate kinase [Candidatus Omnitrophota bacterium]